jgi:hypothetical protein
LCALSCRHCLPDVDNINLQPSKFISGVDPKNPQTREWPSPLPPDGKDRPYPIPENDQHREKRQIPDPFRKDEHVGDHPEDNYPNPNDDPHRPIPLQSPVNPFPPPIHDPDRENPLHPGKYDADDNIPFPRSAEDQFMYPYESKLLRRKRQIDHPLKKDQQRDPNDPIPFDHRDPNAHIPPPRAEQIYPVPGQETVDQFPVPRRGPGKVVVTISIVKM